MSFEDWKEVISNVATVTTIIQFLAGIPVCRRFIRKGTTGDTSGLPFVIGSLNCAVWMKYGVYIKDAPVAVVNGIGCALMCSYAICYYIYTTRSRLHIQKQIVFSVTFFVTVLIITDFYTVDRTHGQYILGVIGCCMAVAFFAAPLTGTTKVLPFGQILANFLAGSLWWIYGLIIQDNFLKIPNFFGTCLALFQLLLYAYFPSRKSSLISPDVKHKKEDTHYLSIT